VTSEQNYSWLDRLFHRIAFSRRAVQLTAADIERTLFGKQFSTLDANAPVFLTSLPRAGTTMMLEALASWPGLATYSYRDMPFVMAPLLWERLSKGFRKPAALRERAHGDGMVVGYDSPEAFEEVLWRAYWPQKFTPHGIELWSPHEEAGEFRHAFLSQMQRIIAVRVNGASEPRRYLSKNNANIARLGLLRRLFPDAVVLVPFRHPLDQAGSLLRQHLRFVQRHRDDAFSKQYMNDIGHLEFGELHRPIRFDGVDDMVRRHRPESIDYWIEYWILAFTHILRHEHEITLISYERLCDSGPAGLRAIVARLGLPDGVRPAGGVTFHPRPSGQLSLEADKHLIDRAQALHARLLSRSLI
jgi:hypothetical protein